MIGAESFNLGNFYLWERLSITSQLMFNLSLKLEFQCEIQVEEIFFTEIFTSSPSGFQHQSFLQVIKVHSFAFTLKIVRLHLGKR